MTVPVKIFQSKVTDEYGGEYPLAIVAVRAFSETSQTTAYSDNCEDNYDTNSEVEAITYKVNYWYSEKTKSEGKRSRPLINDDNGNFTDVFTVNLDGQEVIDILNSESGYLDKILRAVKADAVASAAAIAITIAQAAT